MRRVAIVVLAGVLVSLPAALYGQAEYSSDPEATVSQEGEWTVFSKELNGYTSYPYGERDGAADVLYTGDSATWTFDLPPRVNYGTVTEVFFRAFLVLDDHYNIPRDLYSFAVTANGTRVFDGPAELEHGVPFASTFTNWVARDFAVAMQPGVFANSITIHNTSNTAATGWRDWIAVDRVEMHAVVTPEPISLILLGTGLAGVGVMARRRRRPDADP